MAAIRTLVLSLFLAASASAATVHVAAAISLKEAVTDAAEQFEAKTGDKIEFAFGASGQLEAQIKSGAPVDLFISAANKQVDDLAKEGLVDSATRRVVVANHLVSIVPAGSKVAISRFEDLTQPSVKRVALGEPQTVPAGQYGQEVLKALKLGDALKGRLVYGANVRQVLDYVERGEVDAGLVYATDARESGDKVRIVATAGAETHEPIVYPGVVIKGAKEAEDAKRFLDFLGTKDGLAALTAHGFAPPSASAPEAGSLRVVGPEGKTLVLTAAELAKLPHVTVREADHAGVERAYEGVRLDELLKGAGVPLDAKSLHGGKLSRYLLVEASDAYRVVFALPELSSDFTDRAIILADRCDGQALPVKDGPLQIIVPGEKHHARWVRQVVALRVIEAGT